MALARASRARPRGGAWTRNWARGGGEDAVVPDGVEVAGGVGVGEEGPLAQRDGDAGDGDDGEEGHLEAGLEEAGRARG